MSERYSDTAQGQSNGAIFDGGQALAIQQQAFAADREKQRALARTQIRQLALNLAAGVCGGSHNAEEVIAAAKKFESYLLGDQPAA